jgi:hypothetical protein
MISFIKYWGFLAAKFFLAGCAVAGVWSCVRTVLPGPRFVNGSYLQPFAHDLGYTTAALMMWLAAVGLFYLVILDQRYRCRICLRRLRMPLGKGSWNEMLLVGPPRTEYICPFGHGTLKVPDILVTGLEGTAWAPHQDMWTELALLEDKK